MNQVGSSRMDTVLKMLLIAFISLLAFSSGVYFGKQLSDSDYQLKALESDFNNKHATVASGGGNQETSPEDAIKEEEVAALSEKLVNAEKAELEKDDHGAKPDEKRGVASAEGKDPHGKPAQPAASAGHEKLADKVAHKPEAAHKPDLSAAAKAAMRVANNAAPTDPAKPLPEKRQPTSLPKTVGTSQDVEFTVQVASYPTATAAKEHADELVKKGFPAFPIEASVNGKIWYRVSVGSFKSNRDATAYRAQLVKQTPLPSAIVAKIKR